MHMYILLMHRQYILIIFYTYMVKILIIPSSFFFFINTNTCVFFSYILYTQIEFTSLYSFAFQNNLEVRSRIDFLPQLEVQFPLLNPIDSDKMSVEYDQFSTLANKTIFLYKVSLVDGLCYWLKTMRNKIILMTQFSSLIRVSIYLSQNYVT